MPNADVILLNATIPSRERVNIAVVGPRIVEVAPAGELHYTSGPRTRMLDLKGRLVSPGLWDSHLHFYHWCQMRHQLQLAHCQSREELLAEVSSAPKGTGWLLGQGWNNLRWPDDRPPSRRELDVVGEGRPILLWCSDLHSALASSAALQAAGLLEGHREVPGGLIERDAEGSPTGWLRELAANLARDVVPEPSDSELSALLCSGMSALHRLGVTGFCEQRIKDQNEGPRMFRLLRELELRGHWRLRTSFNVAAHHLEQARTLGLASGFGTDRLRLGHIKVFADGTLGSATARMLEPFLEVATGEDGRGLYLTPVEEMREVFGRAARAGFSISVHAIGDEAIRECLDLFAELDQQGIPRPRIPHRLEHAQILDDADVARFARLGVAVSVQAGHLLDDRDAAERALGPRARLCYRFGDLSKAKANLIFGTDAPVSEIDPRYGMRAAVQRRAGGEKAWFPEQCLPASVVWEGYTGAAARAAGWDDVTGMLVPGLRADLVVWEGDPTSEDPGSRAEVTHTFFDGELVYERD